MATNFPIVIQNALELLSSYLITNYVAFGRSGSSNRRMRCDRRNNILAVASVMLRGAALQFKDGIICHFSGGSWIRPMSIPEIASLAQICPKTVSRCIADLVDLGLVESTQIKRNNPKTGMLEVSIGIRRFTKKFWKALGLWELFKSSCQWARENGKRRLFMPFKSISTKVKETCSTAGNVVKNVLSEISDTQNKIKFNCERILSMVRKN